MSAAEQIWLDYFAGGVPTGETFRMVLEDVSDISASDKQDHGGINRLQELCFIGLMSYFEGFCKDHFASLINIEPELISNLKASGQNVDVDASRVALYSENVNYKIGFVLAERYDFGTALKINSLYTGLLKITPFGSDEARQYAELVRDRNLFVHHGGTFTLSYLEQTPSLKCDVRQQAFLNSRTLTAHDVKSAIRFIEAIARKLMRSSHDAVSRYRNEHNLQYDRERQKALDSLLWWGDGSP